MRWLAETIPSRPTEGPVSHFSVSVVAAETLTAFDHAWSAEDFLSLLDAAGFEDGGELPPGEIEEMCVLSLQDHEPAEAAAIVLEHRLGDRLRKGQIEHLAHEFGDDRQWEHHPDITLHEPLFHVGSLLWRAFPGAFHKPNAVRIELTVAPADGESQELLAEHLDEVLLVRIIADGLPQRALLHRLFEDQLDRGAFEEATAIVWTWTASPMAGGLKVVIVGSDAWIGPLRQAGSWTSDARPAPEEAPHHH